MNLELDTLSDHLTSAAAELTAVERPREAQTLAAALFLSVVGRNGYFAEFGEYDSTTAVRISGHGDLDVLISPAYSWEMDGFDEEVPGAWEATVVDRSTGEFVPMPVPEAELPYVCSTIWAREDLDGDLAAGLDMLRDVCALAGDLLGFSPVINNLSAARGA